MFPAIVSLLFENLLKNIYDYIIIFAETPLFCIKRVMKYGRIYGSLLFPSFSLALALCSFTIETREKIISVHENLITDERSATMRDEFTGFTNTYNVWRVIMLKRKVYRVLGPQAIF